MKIVITLLFISLSYFAHAQAQYEISPDPKHPEVKVFRGIIDKYLIQKDSSFKWYGANQKFYRPDTATLNAFERTSGKIQYV